MRNFSPITWPLRQTKSFNEKHRAVGGTISRGKVAFTLSVELQVLVIGSFDYKLVKGFVLALAKFVSQRWLR